MASSSKYRVALLGCGDRSRPHADVYSHISRAELVATCSRDDKKLTSFSNKYGIVHRYHDLYEMLQDQKPDLLHIVTRPSVRYDVMKIASDLGVPAVIVEKPIALEGEDYRQVAALADQTSTKFAVNTQLHYHEANMTLRRRVATGEIGAIRSIDITARSTLVNQGAHLLQLMSGYTSELSPQHVFAQVSGKHYLETGQEPSPDDVVATIELADNIPVNLTVGERVAPTVSDYESRFFHKHITVHGEKGYARWTMGRWELLGEAGLESGRHDYIEEDGPAQVRLTEAVLDWIESDDAVPAVNLKSSLVEFNLLLGVYVSALERKPTELPCDPPDGLLDRLRDVLD